MFEGCKVGVDKSLTKAGKTPDIGSSAEAPTQNCEGDFLEFDPCIKMPTLLKIYKLFLLHFKNFLQFHCQKLSNLTKLTNTFGWFLPNRLILLGDFCQKEVLVGQKDCFTELYLRVTKMRDNIWDILG